MTDPCGPILFTTDSIVASVACDVSHVKAASNEATNGPLTYTLQVGTPTISPAGGSVPIGSIVQLTTITGAQSFYVQFYYTIDGSTPNCSGGGTSKSIYATNTVTGGFAAYYEITGAEKQINVIGCEAGFTSSAVTQGTTYASPSPAPTFLLGTPGNPYDDVGFDDTVTIQPAYEGSGTTEWLCLGATGCGAVANTCNGTNSTPVTSGTLSETVTYTQQSAPTINGGTSGPASAWAWTADTIPATGTSQSIFSCALAGAGGGVLTGGPATASYTANVSAPSFAPTVPYTGTDTDVTVTLATSTEYPNSSPGGTPASTTDVYLCVSNSNQGIPAQTNSCATMVAALPVAVNGVGWTCTGPTDNPSITFNDVGQTTMYSAFACKDLMNYTSSHLAELHAQRILEPDRDDRLRDGLQRQLDLHGRLDRCG